MRIGIFNIGDVGLTPAAAAEDLHSCLADLRSNPLEKRGPITLQGDYGPINDPSLKPQNLQKILGVIEHRETYTTWERFKFVFGRGIGRQAEKYLGQALGPNVLRDLKKIKDGRFNCLLAAIVNDDNKGFLTDLVHIYAVGGDVDLRIFVHTLPDNDQRLVDRFLAGDITGKAAGLKLFKNRIPDPLLPLQEHELRGYSNYPKLLAAAQEKVACGPDRHLAIVAIQCLAAYPPRPEITAKLVRLIPRIEELASTAAVPGEATALISTLANLNTLAATQALLRLARHPNPEAAIAANDRLPPEQRIRLDPAAVQRHRIDQWEQRKRATIGRLTHAGPEAVDELRRLYRDRPGNPLDMERFLPPPGRPPYQPPTELEQINAEPIISDDQWQNYRQRLDRLIQQAVPVPQQAELRSYLATGRDGDQWEPAKRQLEALVQSNVPYGQRGELLDLLARGRGSRSWDDYERRLNEAIQRAVPEAQREAYQVLLARGRSGSQEGWFDKLMQTRTAERDPQFVRQEAARMILFMESLMRRGLGSEVAEALKMLRDYADKCSDQAIVGLTQLRVKLQIASACNERYSSPEDKAARALGFVLDQYKMDTMQALVFNEEALAAARRAAQQAAQQRGRGWGAPPPRADQGVGDPEIIEAYLYNLTRFTGPLGLRVPTPEMRHGDAHIRELAGEYIPTLAKTVEALTDPDHLLPYLRNSQLMKLLGDTQLTQRIRAEADSEPAREAFDRQQEPLKAGYLRDNDWRLRQAARAAKVRSLVMAKAIELRKAALSAPGQPQRTAYVLDQMARASWQTEENRAKMLLVAEQQRWDRRTTDNYIQYYPGQILQHWPGFEASVQPGKEELDRAVEAGWEEELDKRFTDSLEDRCFTGVLVEFLRQQGYWRG